MLLVLLAFVVRALLHAKTHQEENPIDAIWANDTGEARPPPPSEPVVVLPLEVSGESVDRKVGRIIEEMRQKGAALLCVSALDEVAWLLNLRGDDIAYNPVFFAFVTVADTGMVTLYVDQVKRCTVK